MDFFIKGLLIFVIALASSCATTPKSCAQQALEDAGQALSKTIYALDDQMTWVEMKNNNNISGMYMGSTIDHDWFDTGDTSGQYSSTNYNGLSSREAFNKAMEPCLAKK